MPSPNGYDNKDDFLKVCIPKVLNEGTAKDNSQAYAICNSMWEKKEMSDIKVPNQNNQQTNINQTQLPTSQKPKGKIDFMTEIKKLFEKYGVIETDEKIMEIVNGLNVQGMTMSKRLSLYELQMIDSEKPEQKILVFPRGKHYIQKYKLWLNYDDAFFNRIAKNFNDKNLSQPYIDKDHKYQESYGDITGYEINKEGMFFNIKLNELGHKLVKDGIYKYVSPSFGDVTDTQMKDHKDWLVTISLVNTPASLGMIPALQEQLELSFMGRKKMDEKLFKELGNFITLAGDPSPDAIIQSLPEILKKLQELTDMVTKLTGENQAKDSQIAQQQAAANGKDATMQQMNLQLTAITNEIRNKEADEILKKAVELGQYCVNEKFLEMKRKEFIENPEKIKNELSLIPVKEGLKQLSNSSSGNENIELSIENKKIMDSTGWDSNDPKQVKEWKKLMKEDK